MLNRGPHSVLDGIVHPLLFWPVSRRPLMQESKGTAGKRIQTLRRVSQILRGHEAKRKERLSSGEGLAFAVRDPQYKEEPVKKGGLPTGETSHHLR